MKSVCGWLLVWLLLASFGYSQETDIGAASWSAGGEYLITIGPGRRLRVHDGATGRVLKAIRVPGDATTYISFGPDSGWEEENSLTGLAVSGKRALTCSRDTRLMWWSLPDLELLAQGESTYAPLGLELQAQGSLGALASTSSRYLDSTMDLIRCSTEGLSTESLSDLPPPSSSSDFAVPSLSPDGRWAMASASGFWLLWDLAASQMVARDLPKELPWHTAALGNRAIYLGLSTGISVRAYESPEVETRHFPCPAPPTAVFVSEDESRLLCQCGPNLVMWDLGGEHWLWKDAPQGLRPSPDGRRAFVLGDNEVDVYDLDGRKRLYRLSR